MKRWIPRMITTAVGLLLIVTAFVAHPESGESDVWSARAFQYIDRNVSVWFGILAVFAFILGGASLLKSHVGKILQRRRDWPYSVVTLVSFVVVLVIGLFKLGGEPGFQGEVTAPGAWLTTVYDGLYTPLIATLYALLGFFVASAAYRAFRLRSLEAGVLLVAAFVVMLGRTPLGTWISDLVPPSLSFLRLDTVTTWIVQIPNVAGQRAMLIGIAVGVVALTLRVLAGRSDAEGGHS